MWTQFVDLVVCDQLEDMLMRISIQLIQCVKRDSGDQFYIQ
jgi:hypothetical protein